MTNDQPGTALAARTTTALAIQDEQTGFTDTQLRALGMTERATRDVVETFFHVTKRTGLDPFARQIYCIERGGKWTIQTGIDGYRLVGHRAAKRDGVGVSVDAPMWADEEGVWRELWTSSRPPAAAKVTVWKNGEAFAHTANFREYAQTKSNGDLVQMWAKMPANQIAKCAEAAAWRKAFPADLSGIYVEEEMQQASNPPRGSARSSASRATVTVESLRQPQRPDQQQAMFVALDRLFPDHPATTEQGAADRLAFMGEVLGRQITHTREVEPGEHEKVTAAAQEITDPQEG